MALRIVLAALVLATPHALAQNCDQGWTNVGARCYRYYTSSVSYRDAQHTCNSQSSDLVMFTDFNSANLVLTEFGSELGAQFWIGTELNDNDEVVLQGRVDSAASITDSPGFYAADQPRTDIGRCAKGVNFGQDRGLLWAFSECLEELPFLCQSRCNAGEYYCAGQGCVSESQACYLTVSPSEECEVTHDFTVSNTFRSVGYTTGKYPAGKTCIYHLRTSPDRLLKIQFDVFEMGLDGQDYISIYTGSTDLASANYFGTFDGLSPLQGRIVYSSTNEMLIVMRSDKQTADDRRGFFLTNLILSAPDALTNEDITVGASTTWSSIESPEFGATGGSEIPSITAQWTLTTLPYYQIVFMMEDSLSLGEGSKLELIGYTSAGGSFLLAEYSGEDVNPKVVVSTDNKVIIKYTTGPGPHWNRKGFRLRYIRSSTESCSYTINERRGMLTSPGYGKMADLPDRSSVPVAYPHRYDCTIRLEVPGIVGTPVWNFSLWLDDTFSLEPNDYLTITTYEGEVPTVSVENGTSQSSRTYRSEQYVDVRFFTDSVTPYHSDGFLINFSQDCHDLMVSDWTQLSANPPYKYLDQVTVSCPAGYEFQQHGWEGQSEEIECMEGGWWSVERIPTCQPVFCGRPPKVNNGYVASSDGFLYGDLASYECFGGLTLSGNNNITCQADKTWSTPPTCQELTCVLAAPADPTTTNYTILSGPESTAPSYFYGNTIELQCAPGYIATGNVSVACIGDNVWSAEIGMCEKIRCNFVPIADGRLQLDSARGDWNDDLQYFYQYFTISNMSVKSVGFEDTAYAWCRPGFIVNGTVDTSLEVTCLADGTFDELPLCVDLDECDADPCASDCENTVGSFICSCDEFYSLQNDGTSCQVSSTWCGTYGDRCDGGCVPNQADPALYECTCTEPYVLYTSSGAEGWPKYEDDTVAEVLRINQSCVLPQCPLEAIVTLFNDYTLVLGHSDDTAYPYHYNDFISIQCKEGFLFPDMDLVKEFVCTESGSVLGWFEDETTNLANIQCDTVAVCDGMNSSITGVNSTHPYTVSCPAPFDYDIMYKCELDPDTNTYMLNPDIDCPVIDCGIPAQEQTLGGFDLSAVGCMTFGCSFEFTCNAGNVLRPDDAVATVVCQDTGRWNFSNLYCEGSTCADPGIPGNAYRYANVELDDTTISLPNLREGGSVYFACILDGYVMRNLDTGDLQNSIDCNGTAFSTTVDRLQCVDETAPTVTDCPESIDVFKYEKYSSAPFVDKYGYRSPNFSDNTGIASIDLSPLYYHDDYLFSENITFTWNATDFNGNSLECSIDFIVWEVSPPALECQEEIVVILLNKTAPVNLTDAMLAPSFVDPAASLSYSLPDAFDSRLVTYNNRTFESLHVTVTAARTFRQGPTSMGDNRIDTRTMEATCVSPIILRPADCSLEFAPTPSGASYTSSINAATGVTTITYTCEAVGATFGLDYTSNTKDIQCGTAIGVTQWDPVPDCSTGLPSIYSSGHNAFISGISASCAVSIRDNYGSYIREALCPDLITFLTFSPDEAPVPYLAVNIFPDIIATATSVQIRHYNFFTEMIPGSGKVCGDRVSSSMSSYPFLNSTRHFPDCQTSATSPITVFYDASYKCREGFVRALTGTTEVQGETIDVYQCFDCSSGSAASIANTKAQAPCIPCAANQYDDGDQVECVDCSTGFGSIAGSQSCQAQCPAGFYNNDTGIAPCRPCPINTYWTDSFTCTECEAGKFNGLHAQTSNAACKVICPAGSYSISGYAPCEPCPVNFYQPDEGQSECLRCGAGNHTVFQTSQAVCGPMPPCGVNECSGSACSPFDGQYMCMSGCNEGKIGSLCTVDIGFCDSKPCDMKGTIECSAGACSCNENFAWGETCSNITNTLCDTRNCQNGGRCIVQPTSLLPGANLEAVCLCSGQWSGDRCTEVADRCEENPCAAGQSESCSSQEVRHECDCTTGFTGYYCEIDIDACESSPCYNGGTCSDAVGGAAMYSYSCECLDGFSGSRCETRDNQCEEIPCGSSAVCVDDFRTNETVSCISNFYKAAVDPISSLSTTSWCRSLNITCQNGGQCRDVTDYTAGGDRYRCQCDDRYAGQFCQHRTDFCVSLDGHEKCMPGNCTNLDGTAGYECSYCPPGYVSYSGECRNLNECQLNRNICNGRGLCSDTIGSYVCSCLSGYAGSSCQTEIDECISSPCLHGGTCSDLINDFSCQCPPQRYGRRCELVEDTCSDQCENSGRCYPVFDNYVCDCVQPSYGRNCEILQDVCVTEQPCTYGGDCLVDEGLNVTCSNCNMGHHGQYCELWTDECTVNPCLNDGNCSLSYQFGYECECPTGFTGANCQINLNPCLLSPCSSAASCVPQGEGSFYCQCPAGRFGLTCNRDIDSDFQLFIQPGSAPISLRRPLISTDWQTDEFTLSAWVRPDRLRDDNEAPIIILQVTIDGEPLLTLTTCSFHLAGQNFSYFVREGECLPQALWGFIGVSVDPEAPSLTVYTASLARQLTITTVEPANGLIDIVISPDGEFLGVVSQVTLWAVASFAKGTQQGIDFQTLPSREVGLAPVGETYRADDILYYWSSGSYSSDPFVQLVRPADYCNCGDEAKRGTYLSFGEGCPGDIAVVTSSRSARVSWTPPTFMLNGVGVNPETPSITPGQELAVGSYDVTYRVVKEAASLQCSFKIFVRHGCPGSSINGKCYEVIEELTTFDRAITRCANIGAQIADIPDAATNVDLQAALTARGVSGDYFIGQQWVTGGAAPGVTYYTRTTSFYTPTLMPHTDNDPDCITVNLDGDWTFTDCDNSTGLVCQRDIIDTDGCEALPSPSTLSLSSPAISADRRYTRYELSCPADFVLTSTSPREVTCYPEGDWDYALAQNTNRFPGCGASMTTNVQISTEFVIPSTGQCPASGLSSLLANIRASLALINAVWDGFCAEADCSDVKLCCAGNAICDTNEDCTSSPRRIVASCSSATGNRKKRAAQSTNGINILLDALPPIISSGGESLTPQQILERFIIDLQHFLDKANQVINVPDDADPLTGYTISQDLNCPIGQEPIDTNCVECPAGQYEANGACDLCPLGTYQSQTGQTSCETCPGGNSTVFAGAISMSQCTGPCEAGSFYDGSDCRLCALGFYQPDSGQLSCLPCPLGTNTEDMGSTQDSECIDQCPSGEQFSAASGDCVPCEIGFYRDALAHTMCQACPANKITPAEGATEVGQCTLPDCAPGTYLDVDQCVDCDQGSYQPDGRQIICIDCEANYTTLGLASTSRTDCAFICPNGTEQLTAAEECSLCPVNKYRQRNDSDLAGFCTECPEYFYTENPGGVHVEDCIVLMCPRGMQSNATNATCEECPMGSYSDGETAAGVACTACPDSFTTNGTGFDNEIACLRYCESGFEFDGTACVPCSEFQYKDNADGFLGMCLTCPDGNVTLIMNATSVDDCAYADCQAGYKFSSDKTCEACGAGFYSTDRWQMNCEPCPLDHTTAMTNSTSSDDCYLECPVGKKASEGVCVPCDIGEYSDGPGNQCTACFLNSTTPSNGSTSAADCTIRLCPAGYKRVEVDESCVECGIGEYQDVDLTTSTSCQSCPDTDLNVAQTTGDTGSTSLQDCQITCPDGQEDIDNVCVPCPIGTYKEARGPARCTACPANFTTEAVGSKDDALCSVAVCPAGSFSLNSACQLCPLNTFQSDNDFTGDSCTLCPSDGPDSWITDQVGSTNSTQCRINCTVGTEQTGDTCTDCTLNMYRDDSSLSCIDCPSGLSTNGLVRRTSEDDCSHKICAAGEQNVAADLKTCEACPVNTYSESIGTATCRGCPNGKITLSSGSTLLNQCLDPCPAGTEYDLALTACRSCKKGFYKNDTLDIACKPCAAGLTTDGEGATSCEYKSCLAGEYPLRDTTTSEDVCTPCAVGFYQPDPAEVYCIACGNRRTTASEGSIAETQCVDHPTCLSLAIARVNPCGKLQSCIDLDNGIDCACPFGYDTNGTVCDHVCKRPDLISYCTNGGSCNGATVEPEKICSCTADYVGPTCEEQRTTETVDSTILAVAGVISGIILLVVIIAIIVHKCLRGSPKRTRPSDTMAMIDAPPIIYVPDGSRPASMNGGYGDAPRNQYRPSSEISYRVSPRY